MALRPHRFPPGAVVTAAAGRPEIIGGAAGPVALSRDLRGAAAALERAADRAARSTGLLTRVLVVDLVALVSGVGPATAAVAPGGVLRAGLAGLLDGPDGLRDACARLERLGRDVRELADRHEAAERTAADAFDVMARGMGATAGALLCPLGLPGLGGRPLVAAAAGRNAPQPGTAPTEGADRLVALVPAAVSGCTGLPVAGAVGLARAASTPIAPFARDPGPALVREIRPGHPGAGPSPGRGPTGVADVMLGLTAAYRGGRVIRVQRVDAAAGRAWVVSVPGVRTWGPAPGADPFDLTSAVRAMAGRRGVLAEAVTEAMTRSGVRPGEPVLLAGHSLGGIVVAGLAGDPAFRHRFRVTHVVTAGSPIATRPVPDDIRLLELEHRDDPVVALDGRDPPDAPHRITVRAEAPLSPAHGPAGYLRTARQLDALPWPGGRDPLAGWREGFERFSGAAGPARSFVVTRAPAPGGGP